MLSFDLQVRLGAFDLAAAAEIDTARVTAVFGPSGSGKSTLLRILAGLERNAEGRLSFDGESWLDSRRRVDLPAHRRPVGYMFQEARLFPHLSAEGNLRYAKRRARRLRQVVGFGEVVDALDLAPLLPRRVDGLSGGERQRVALGRTLLAQPRLLLLDEPLSALDASRKMEILPYLEALHPRFGIPTLYVSHSVDEVALLADRMLVLTDGRVTAEGRTGEILESLDLGPHAGRSGTATVVEARVVRHDDDYQLTWLDLAGQPLVVPRRGRFEEGEEACVVIRARDVSLATSRPQGVSIQNVLAGTVAEMREAAGSAFAEVSVDLGPHRLLARITRRSLDHLGLREGDPVFALLKSVSLSKMRAMAGSETGEPLHRRQSLHVVRRAG
ncbi:MAG TPA: molybdenum ABC transporter ATP-binding protein [Thermoanaerobaculia bacterium]|nr:molybdenum ABC transporter ATP-binding protein [Thermoanaerobaculia bacterium]